ncbi:MAG: hypothetical protein HY321_21420 [Armatimonadetes bacterium]|nr:hypothetical protein [Armatimonadota bacterium]
MRKVGASQEETLCRCVSRRQVRAFLALAWLVNGLLLVGNLMLAAGWKPPLNTIAHQINLDHEAVFGSWYPSALLLALGWVALLQFAAGRGWWTARFGWLALALLATALSASEVSQFHEILGRSFKSHVGGTLLGMRTQWPIVLSPFILLSVVTLVAFVRQELARVPAAARLALLGLACWLVAIVLELHDAPALLTPEMRLIHALEVTIEEVSEMVGATLLLTAALRFGFATSKGGSPGACGEGAE